VRLLELPGEVGALLERVRFGQLRFRHVYSVTAEVLRAP
jgi:hypothetical protein